MAWDCKTSAGRCCCSTTPPPGPCPGGFQVDLTLTEPCRYAEGATVTFYNSGNLVDPVETATSDEDGKVQITLPGLPANQSYKFSVSYKGISNPQYSGSISRHGNGLYGLGGGLNGFNCRGGGILSFPSFFIRVRAVGCGQVILPGATITVYWPGIPTATPMGSGTTGDDGWADIELDSPNLRGGYIVLKGSHGQFEDHYIAVDQWTGVACTAAVAMHQPGLGPSAIGLPGDTGTPGGPKPPTSCCNTLNAMANRVSPYPGTLTATIAGTTIPLEYVVNGLWRGHAQFDTMGYPVTRHVSDGGSVYYNADGCPGTIYTRQPVSGLALATFTCFGLSVVYPSCQLFQPGDGAPLGVTWEQYNEVTGWPLSNMNCSTNSYSGDPLVVEGDSSYGPWTVSE